MITPAYSPSATERVLPRLALDFTTGILDPRVTVARALNTATRVNSSGLIETVNADLPRFDYDPVTLAPKGLLIEEARTNLLNYSALVGGTNWGSVKAGTALSPTITTSYATAPDGTQSASRLQLSLGGGSTTSDYVAIQHNAVTITNGSAYAPSIYLKSNDGNSYTVLYRDDLGAGGTSQLWVITPNWQRFTLSYTATSTSGYGIKLWLRGGLGTSATADILAWGGQHEPGAFATSHIPTTTTSLTRNADVVTMTGTNFSSWYNASEGTFTAWYSSFAATSSASKAIVAANDGTTTNRIYAYLSTTARPSMLVSVSGTAQVSMTNNPVSSSINAKTSMAYKADTFAIATDGATPTLDTAGTIPTVNKLEIGCFASASNLNGHMQRLFYYPQRLLNAEAQAFSK